jgi:coenzyme F420-reducing hydrogenase gamma subunit
MKTALPSTRKPRIAVHKFASCDGCQLAFLNAGEDLLTLAGLVDIVHFAEAGPVAPDAEVDIAFVEGSISTPEDIERIARVRANSAYLVTIGACATAGGVQALRNTANAEAWRHAVYARPEYVSSLAASTPIAAHVKVDLELWGCPVNGRQLLAAVRALLSGVPPVAETDKVCMECKRHNTVCVLVARGEPCMGPVTRTGCGALCPRFGRACYACFGPAEDVNTDSFSRCLRGLGLADPRIAARYAGIANAAPEFAHAALAVKAQP